jgi:hypothetical protein
MVAACVVLLAGCGGPGVGFAQQANDACSDANERVRALGPEPPILTAEQAHWLETLTRIDRETIATLRALEPPEDERGPISSMLTGFERGLAHGVAIARASREDDFPTLRSEVDAANVEFGRARTIAEQHGLDQCALLGRVDR